MYKSGSFCRRFWRSDRIQVIQIHRQNLATINKRSLYFGHEFFYLPAVALAIVENYHISLAWKLDFRDKFVKQFGVLVGSMNFPPSLTTHDTQDVKRLLREVIYSLPHQITFFYLLVTR